MQNPTTAFLIVIKNKTKKGNTLHKNKIQIPFLSFMGQQT